jgi:tRNA-splicing ligase RtcB
MYVIKDDDMKIPLKIFSTEGSIEPQCIDQMKMVAKSPFLFKHISLMPDGHLGIGASIGSVVPSKDVVFPSLVGVDIGCGMSAAKTSLTDIDIDTIKSIMGEIRKVVPVGFSHHQEAQVWTQFDNAPDLPIIQKELSSARNQLGTLGGGNHFIEIQRGDDGHIWVMLHSGSRNFGLKTATEYHKKAQALCERWVSNIPDKDLAFLPLEEKDGQDYLKAMNYCLDFAFQNRALMMKRILDIFKVQTGAYEMDEVNIHHNYAIMEHHFGQNVLVHRKGATKATLGLRGIIPGSMGTHSYIVEGLGNPDSFESCSHGAGRRMGRKEAARVLNLEEEQKKMTGIVNGLRTAQDLDEAPGAYKDIDIVMENQKDLVKKIVELTPLASIKG